MYKCPYVGKSLTWVRSQEKPPLRTQQEVGEESKENREVRPSDQAAFDSIKWTHSSSLYIQKLYLKLLTF